MYANCGADPLVCSRPPGRLLCTFGNTAMLTEADEGVCRGPGGPPHHEE